MILYKNNYALLKNKGNHSYFISIELITKFDKIFEQIDKPNEIVKIKINEDNKNKILNFNKNDLKSIQEKEISYDFIKKLIPNYFSDLPEEIYWPRRII